MGFLKKFFATAEIKETKVLPWINLTEVEQINLISERSKSKIQIIFKYSSRCSINRIMFNRFVDSYELSESSADLYYLDIINYRELSSLIANKFQILHESPQVLIVRNGVVVAHESHGAISKMNINTYI